MDDRQRIIQALEAIDPSRLTYQEWIDVGMALNSEGFPVSVWDDWSRKDISRYHSDECSRKWDTFHGVGTTAGTIFHIAEQQGYKPHGKVYSWDDFIPAEVENYEETIASNAPKKDKPYQMAIKYLETLFEPDEIVGYVHSAIYKEDRQKWVPANAGAWRKRDDIIADLKKYKNFDAFGSMNDEAGAWIRINPLDGKGAGDKNVTRYTYALAEADSMPIEEQKKLLINLKLPIAALVESGGKSVHAIVKVGALNKAEYDQRVKLLFAELAKRNFIVDTNNANPSRLSRLPGVMRGDKCQTLLATNIGCSTWEEWLDELNGINDDLPAIDNLWDMFEAPDETPDEVIASILYEGGKLMITGDSKSGKTCMSQNLAVCIASGAPWLGKYQCKQGKVLYINLEIRKEMLKRRFRLIFKELGIKATKSNVGNIHPWNLRGKALPLDMLAKIVIRRARFDGPYTAIVLDPVYKVQQGDENSAEAISKFCNALDKIAEETGAAVIYDHHHPKGDSGQKKAIDRGAGSGVFARDADALIDISNLDPGNDASDLVKELTQNGEKPMILSFVLRDFKDQPEQKVWFKYPLHYVDSANLLDNCYIEGSPEANFGKNSNRISDDEKRRIVENAFISCQKDGRARTSDMAAVAEMTPKTIREYAIQLGEYDVSERGYIKRNIDDLPDVLKQ